MDFGNTTHLRLKSAFDTESSNINAVYSYYYRTGGREVNVKLADALNRPADLQKMLRVKSSSFGCSIQ